MSNKKIWGPIITSEEIDEEDPIRKLLNRIEATKYEKIDFSLNQTLKEIKEEKAEKLNKLEKEISDILYARQLKRMMA